ncbi:MAG: HAD family hydrolase [Lachnospiraceae bacterium]|nr:HAD family hydrolase [Lachnospiraceae bacterium]
MKKRNYIFDLYGTLCDIHTDESKASLWKKMAELYGSYGAVYDWRELKQSYKNLCREESFLLEKEMGKYSEIELRKVFFKLFETKGVVVDDSLVDFIAVTFRVLSRSLLYVYDGIVELLDEIHRQGGKNYLLSNAQNVFTIPELKVLYLYDKLDGIYISSDKRMKKPDPRFLEALLKEYDLKREESIIIGNDRTTDIAIANACGIESIYIHSNNSYPNLKNAASQNQEATYEVLDGDIYKVNEILFKEKL